MDRDFAWTARRTTMRTRTRDSDREPGIRHNLFGSGTGLPGAAALLLASSLGACVGVTADDDFDRVPHPTPAPCAAGGESHHLLQAGSLSLATHYDCEAPDPAVDLPKFTSFHGNTSVVNGGSMQLLLDFEGLDTLDGHVVLLALAPEDGYFAVPLSGASPVPLELWFNQNAPSGQPTLRLAIDDGLGTPETPHIGEWLAIPLTVIGVAEGGADIQVTLSWFAIPETDVFPDVDLFVRDPAGEVVWYGQTEVASGGELDLDSNAACATGDSVENVYWGVGEAAPGTYEARVSYWSNCTFAGTVAWRVSVIVSGVLLGTYEGQLEADEAWGGGWDEAVPATTFEF
jgi:hypothetical protein